MGGLEDNEYTITQLFEEGKTDAEQRTFCGLITETLQVFSPQRVRGFN